MSFRYSAQTIGDLLNATNKTTEEYNDEIYKTFASDHKEATNNNTQQTQANIPTQMPTTQQQLPTTPIRHNQQQSEELGAKNEHTKGPKQMYRTKDILKAFNGGHSRPLSSSPSSPLSSLPTSSKIDSNLPRRVSIADQQPQKQHKTKKELIIEDLKKRRDMYGTKRILEKKDK